jgi:uncharacterized protein (TIRG00374 family)
MKKRVTIILVALVIGVFIYLVKDISLLEVYNVVKSTKLLYFFLAVFSCFCGYLLWTLRWKINLAVVQKSSFWNLFVFLLSWLFFNLITPGRSIGGEFVAAYFLSKKYKKPKTKFIGTIIADRFFYVISLFVVVFLALLYILLFFKLPHTSRIFLEVLFVGIGFLMFLFIFFMAFRKKITLVPFFSLLYHKFIKYFYRISHVKRKYLVFKFRQFGNVFYSIIHHRKIAFVSIIISFSIWCCSFLTSYFLFLSFGLHVGFILVAVIVPIGYFFGDISIIPGGIGFIEGTTYLLYSASGISKEIALLVVLLNTMITGFFNLFLGSIFSLYIKIKYD